jgi:hypothetical protein
MKITTWFPGVTWDMKGKLVEPEEPRYVVAARKL